MFEVLCKGKMSYAKRVLIGHMSSYVTEFVQWEGVKAALSPVVHIVTSSWGIMKIIKQKDQMSIISEKVV